jgi:lysophospholipase L1-like esterase
MTDMRNPVPRSNLLILLAAAWLASVRAETGHDFARWEPEIAAFEQADRAVPPPKGAILFIGSSTIRLWTTLAEDFPHHRVLNRGFGGSEIVDSTHFAERIIFPYAPRVVFLRAGGNDLHAGRTPEEVLTAFKEFVAVIHGRLPAAEIVFIGLCPSMARWGEAGATRALNAMVEAFARDTPKVRYLESYALSLGSDGQPRRELFREDGLHFNAAGYRLLAERIRPFLPPVPEAKP